MNTGGTQHVNGVNPLLNVQPPILNDAESAALSYDLDVVSEAANEPVTAPVYATNILDRRRPIPGRAADSRWPRRHRDPRVPEIDVRLVVAFQKYLREEQYEFLLLVTAIADDEDCCH